MYKKGGFCKNILDEKSDESKVSIYFLLKRIIKSKVLKCFV